MRGQYELSDVIQLFKAKFCMPLPTAVPLYLGDMWMNVPNADI